MTRFVHSTPRPLPRGARPRRAVLEIALLAFVLLATSVLSVAPAAADTHSDYLVDHGIAIYYAVIPAEMIRGHPKQHPEATMHGGVPNRPHAHHIMVALFDEASLDRIVDAEVTATVSEIGLAGEKKTLEPFTVAGALTYGNYFELRPNTTYRVRVEVKTPRPGAPASVEFEFKHQ